MVVGSALNTSSSWLDISPQEPIGWIESGGRGQGVGSSWLLRVVLLIKDFIDLLLPGRFAVQGRVLLVSIHAAAAAAEAAC